MEDKILLALFLLIAPLLFVVSIVIMFYTYWLFISDTSFIDFMQLPTSQSMGNVSILFAGVSALAGALLALNIIVLLNTKYKWMSNNHIKNKIGKDISRYVYFPST